jgi:hypothetical protein
LSLFGKVTRINDYTFSVTEGYRFTAPFDGVFFENDYFRVNHAYKLATYDTLSNKYESLKLTYDNAQNKLTTLEKAFGEQKTELELTKKFNSKRLFIILGISNALLGALEAGLGGYAIYKGNLALGASLAGFGSLQIGVSVGMFVISAKF